MGGAKKGVNFIGSIGMLSMQSGTASGGACCFVPLRIIDYTAAAWGKSCTVCLRGSHLDRSAKIGGHGPAAMSFDMEETWI